MIVCEIFLLYRYKILLLCIYCNIDVHLQCQFVIVTLRNKLNYISVYYYIRS